MTSSSKPAPGRMHQRIQTELGKRRKERKAHNRQENDRRTVGLLLTGNRRGAARGVAPKVLDRFHLLTLEHPPQATPE